MALIKASSVINEILNSGVEVSNKSLGPTAMLIFVPPTFAMTAADIADFDNFIKNAIHAASANRVYPFFGNNAPIVAIDSSKENDVIANMDNGQKVFIRYGFLNKKFSTISGGVEYAKKLQSLTKSSYRVLEIDNLGNVLLRPSGSDFTGLKQSFIYSPTPDPSDFKMPEKYHAELSYDPREYVACGLYEGGVAVLDYNGLRDSYLDATGLTQATTSVKFRPIVRASKENLCSTGTIPIENKANYVVTAKIGGAVITISAGTNQSNDYVQLAGTFVSGSTYVITPASAATLLTNGVEFIDFEGAIEVTIP